MKKFLLILFSLVLWSSLNAYSKEDVEDCKTFSHQFGLIVRGEEVLNNGNSDYQYALEHNAYAWFKENYVDKGTGIVIKLTDTNLKEEINSCGTLWVVIAPYTGSQFNADSYNDPNFYNSDFLDALKEHVAKGASLYLSNFATKLLSQNNGIGRLSDGYAPKDGQSDNWPEDDGFNWYVCPLIGVKDGKAAIDSEENALYNNWNHPIYKGLRDNAVTSTNNSIVKALSIPISSESVDGKNIARKNVYCFWNMANYGRFTSPADDQNALVLAEFQSQTHSKVLGTTEWAKWYNNAAIVEFEPAHSADGKTVFDGTIIANGLAGCAYEIHSGDKHDDYEKNAYQINANALEYLSTLAFTRGNLNVKSIADLNWVQNQDGCWSTLYCEHNKILPEKMEAYLITNVKDETASSPKYGKIVSRIATLTQVAGNKNGFDGGLDKMAILPANHGYLLRTNDKVPDKTIVLENTKVASTFSMDEYNTSYPTDDNKESNTKLNYLMGSEEKKTFYADNQHVFYILAGERRINTNEWSYGFYIKRDENNPDVSKGIELENAAHRAFVYAPKPTDSGSSAKPLLFSFDTGETTGIENLRTETRAQDGFCYNMAGQRVGKDYKGLVIKNGKKYLVK